MPATYIGKGKAEELRHLAEALDIDVVMFDDELTPAQQRNLEKIFKVDVVDRAALILDIFAQHASSQEGMIQVELAQLRYQLPRLRGRGGQLSQQAGGIGARRGPGETQLEVDRRRLVRRVQKLERDLREVAATRATQRKARQRRELFRVALVGYTNAGKSTLLNRLTNAGVLVEDQLFSTLDPTTRRLHLPGGETVLMSDTVGFVRKLPHQLVEAFRSTLDEVADADLLVHLVDASAPDPDLHIDAVESVLREIDAGDVPELLVWTKSDRAERDDVKRLVAAHRGSVAISARDRRRHRRVARNGRGPAANAHARRRVSWSPTTGAMCSRRCTERAKSSSRCTPTPGRVCRRVSPTRRRSLRRVHREHDAECTHPRTRLASR